MPTITVSHASSSSSIAAAAFASTLSPPASATAAITIRLHSNMFVRRHALSQKTIEKAPKEKKPLSGYMLFAKEKRPDIIKKSPELTFGEVGKALGAAWKALSETEKAKYKK